MIRTLRIKFVILSMSLLLALLIVLLTAINLMNYNTVISYSDTVLAILAQNEGSFPDSEYFEEWGYGRSFSEELPYEARFFTVQLDSSGDALYANTAQIATVDQDTAIEYAQQVLDSGSSKGFLGDYRYALSHNQSGTLVIFLDCGRKLEDFSSFMWTSIWITLAGMAVVLILLIFLSKRIMRPFVENYEKQKSFITNASHELKTPLTIIDADAEVLQMDIGENEWLEDIQNQTKRLASMTNALVYLSRMEEPNSKMQMIDFPLSDIVAETAQSFQSLAISQGKQFTTDIQPMLSICGDEKSFHELTSILLDNAVKYSGEGGSIALTLNRTGNAIQLSVQNTCENISPEDLHRLFDRFYRTDKSRNSETGGSGIGLSIAKAIVTAHKGSIKAAAPDDHTLRITAIFPA